MSGSEAPQIIPWVEKYRPQSIDEVVQQDEVVNALRTTVSTGDLPHLIFHGPPGTGKTSTALALCKMLFSPSEIKRRVMELNASDERGIDAVRKKVKQFASLAVPSGKFPYKIIILDEADSMTKDAQNALRRIIEQHSAVTRFIIICNYVSKIIDPILSRCARFRFTPLEHNSIVNRLRTIIEGEGIQVDGDETYEALVAISNGDLRKAITFAQSASSTGRVTSSILRDISGTPDPKMVEEFFDCCLNGIWSQIEESSSDIVNSGYDIGQVLQLLTSFVVQSNSIHEKFKPKLLLHIAKVDGMIIERADPQIQFLSLASLIMNSK